MDQTHDTSGLDGYGAPQRLFLIKEKKDVSCHGFMGKIVEWFLIVLQFISVFLLDCKARLKKHNNTVS